MDIDQYRERNRIKKGVKKKSTKQEKRLAAQIGGKSTIASGSLHFDKADVKKSGLRGECKRTDKESIIIKKEYLLKLRSQCKVNERPFMNIEIQDENWFLVTKEDFLNILEVAELLDKIE